ncbi:MAG: hypothetical protein ACI8UD_002937 [Planctomycetota bacterium]|jgi:hypothetical protein
MELMKGKWLSNEFLVRTCVLCVLFGCLLRPGNAAFADLSLAAANRECDPLAVALAGLTLAAGADTLAAGADAPAAAADPVSSDQQDDPVDLDKLRSMLDKSGPEGRAERESAVAQLLAIAKPDAHRLLQERLWRKADPDGLRLTILTALQGHLLLNTTKQFGSAAETARQLIILGYVDACARFWSGADDVVDVVTAPVLIAARQMLRRIPVRELDGAARTLMTSIKPPDRVLVLRCLADMQQTLLAKTIADQLEDAEPTVRAGAQKALQLLTYADRPIRTKADFDAWSARFGTLRYIDLAERAARNGPATMGRLRDDLQRERVNAARDIVAVLIAPKPTINWAAVERSTLSDGPAVLDACLQALQAVLVNSTSVDGPAAPRQAFFRSLLDRFAKVGNSQEVDVQHRRALLLEVAAYLVKPEEAEFAIEIRKLLVAHLAAPSTECQVAALRGLRRFPSADARMALVRRARQLLAADGKQQEQLQVMLETLASRTEPRWVAPSVEDADKSEWLKLVDESCRTKAELGLRTKALKLAQTQTANRGNERVPEAFAVLLALANDPALDKQFRSTCLIHLGVWQKEEDLAEQWLAALQKFLESDEPVLRRQAAASLVQLPASTDPDRAEWFTSSMSVLGKRLIVEPDVEVLRALVECVKVIGREPNMAEESIGALKFVVAQLGDPIAPENAFRLNPLLQALGQIAAEPNTEPGQWLAACDPLLKHGERQSLRLVLRSHDAITLAKDVKSPDKAVVDRACMAMRYLIEAAVLKPAADEWSSSEDLLAEARDVRSAFEALDTVEAARRLDRPEHRLVRLTVALVAQDYQEVVNRATSWLKAEAQKPTGLVTATLDQLRLLAAKAQLELGQPKLALALLKALSPTAAKQPDALLLASRIAKALVEGDTATAVQVFEQAMRATSAEDPLFRVRLLDWMQTSIRHQPKSRKETLAEGEKHAALFAASDCPEALSKAFEQLRSSN